jgi:hypothetical protein
VGEGVQQATGEIGERLPGVPVPGVHRGKGVDGWMGG